MEALTISTQAVTVRNITEDICTRFVAYIDRTAATARTYIINLRQWAAYLRYTAVQQPTRETVISYREWLGTEHDALELDAEAAAGWSYRLDNAGARITITCKPTTISQYLRTVKALYAWAAHEGLYPNIGEGVHGPKVTRDAHRKDGLSVEQVQTVENAITAQAAAHLEAAACKDKDREHSLQRTGEQDKRLYAMYLLAVNLGLRTVEISRARVKDLEQVGGRYYLRIQGKGHTEADAKKPLAQEVAEALRDYLSSRTDSYTGSSPLFVSTGNRSGGKAIASTTISKMLKAAMVDAGFNSDRLTAHSLRHSTAQAVLELTGDNIYKAQQYLRHGSTETTQIYINARKPEEEAPLADQLYKAFHGGKAEEARGVDALTAAAAALTPEQVAQLAAIAQAMAR